ncbi:MAG: glycoside hydrolase family 140 protein [Acidobacteria bacterium]|nr:glycoside hydrolase family 140 protein [Acidobacteriota bacterium]
MNRFLIPLTALAVMFFSAAVSQPQATRSVKGMKLAISPNKRYLVNQNGEPFLYLADTAWTLFRRLDRDEVEEYLQNRAAKGFTVVQAYLFRGLGVPNRYGEVTFIDRDPTKPNEAWFKNVDYVVNRANELGLVMGIVASKGDHVKQRQWPVSEVVFNETNAFTFGKFVGNRYRNNAVIWYLGGDTVPAETRAVWIAMARGLKEGSQGLHLVSYHGPGPAPGPKDYSSSFWFHNEDWLDFNVIQSGHKWGAPNYEFVAHDYSLTPVKPTIDMEARYENHLADKEKGRRIDGHQVRQAAYWNLLAGAAGHGYGCNDIFQFYDPASPPDKKDYTFPFNTWLGTVHWRQAMDLPGAKSIRILRKLFESRPWHRLVPDNSLIAAGQGEGENHVQAAIAADASFAIAYLPFGNPISIRLDRLSGPKVKAQWYDPREGTWIPIGQYSNTGIREFVPPSNGKQNDWVLVLEDMGKNYPLEKPQ